MQGPIFACNLRPTYCKTWQAHCCTEETSPMLLQFSTCFACWMVIPATKHMIEGSGLGTLDRALDFRWPLSEFFPQQRQKDILFEGCHFLFCIAMLVNQRKWGHAGQKAVFVEGIHRCVHLGGWCAFSPQNQMVEIRMTLPNRLSMRSSGRQLLRQCQVGTTTLENCNFRTACTCCLQQWVHRCHTLRSFDAVLYCLISVSKPMSARIFQKSLIVDRSSGLASSGSILTVSSFAARSASTVWWMFVRSLYRIPSGCCLYVLTRRTCSKLHRASFRFTVRDSDGLNRLGRAEVIVCKFQISAHSLTRRYIAKDQTYAIHPTLLYLSRERQKASPMIHLNIAASVEKPPPLTHSHGFIHVNLNRHARYEEFKAQQSYCHHR